jgi:hypothetical protein
VEGKNKRKTKFLVAPPYGGAAQSCHQFEHKRTPSLGTEKVLQTSSEK